MIQRVVFLIPCFVVEFPKDVVVATSELLVENVLRQQLGPQTKVTRWKVHRFFLLKVARSYLNSSPFCLFTFFLLTWFFVLGHTNSSHSLSVSFHALFLASFFLNLYNTLLLKLPSWNMHTLSCVFNRHFIADISSEGHYFTSTWGCYFLLRSPCLESS